MGSTSAALVKVARDIDKNVGWQAATYLHRQDVITDEEYEMITKFERLEDHEIELSERQRHARRVINTKILNSFTELELFGMGINTDELSVARNGWRHDYQPVF